MSEDMSKISLRETDEMSKLGRLGTNQRFCEDVGWHIVGSAVVENDRSFGLTDVVTMDRDMLSP